MGIKSPLIYGVPGAATSSGPSLGSCSPMGGYSRLKEVMASVLTCTKNNPGGIAVKGHPGFPEFPREGDGFSDGRTLRRLTMKMRNVVLSLAFACAAALSLSAGPKQTMLINRLRLHARGSQRQHLDSGPQDA